MLQSPKTPEYLISLLQQPLPLEASPHEENDSDAGFPVTILKSSEFDFDLSCQIIGSLQQQCTGNDATSAPVKNFEAFDVCSRINIESVEIVTAIGGLVNCIKRVRLDSQAAPLLIRDIRTFSLNDYLYLDLNTLQSLNIFNTEHHPSIIKGKGRSKEGFSLFAILDKTCSLPGRRLLRRWMLRPSLDIEEIKARNDAVELFVQPTNAEFLMHLQRSMKKVYDLSRILRRIRTVSASIGDWKNLLSTTSEAVTIDSFVKTLLQTSPHSRELPVLLRIIHHVGAVCNEVYTLVTAVINLELSLQQDKLVINDDVDEDLNEYRRVYARLDDCLTGVGEQELSRYPSVSSLVVKYIPQIGYVVSIDPQENAPSEGEPFTPPSDFEFQFNVDGCHHFKTPGTRQLDEMFGDISSQVSDLEGFIARQLEDRLLVFEPQLLQASEAMAELDVLLCFATCAVEYNYSRPVLRTDACLYAKASRHPLQELVVENYIPNDIAIAPGREGGLCVLTGPNYSGKSVYLKQIGLLAYMGILGSFVPAEQAHIPIIDRIFTRIESLESVSITRSAFAIDLNQIVCMLRHCTPRSLLLIDEFGKGTASSDGVALMSAVVRHLSRSPVNGLAIPKTILTTHYKEIFALDLLEGCSGILTLMMETILSTGEQGSESLGQIKEVVPLYKVVPGKALQSYGLSCAIKAGVPEHIVQRAHTILSSIQTGACIFKKEGPPSSQDATKTTLLVEELMRHKDWKTASDEEIQALLRFPCST